MKKKKKKSCSQDNLEKMKLTLMLLDATPVPTGLKYMEIFELYGGAIRISLIKQDMNPNLIKIALSPSKVGVSFNKAVRTFHYFTKANNWLSKMITLYEKQAGEGND
jgi:hypothetical protein